MDSIEARAEERMPLLSERMESPNPYRFIHKEHELVVRHINMSAYTHMLTFDMCMETRQKEPEEIASTKIRKLFDLELSLRQTTNIIIFNIFKGKAGDLTSYFPSSCME